MEILRYVIEELCKITEQLNDERLITLAKFLSQRINNPDTYLVFLGESCSGKSTLINAIIDKDVLPVSGIPSTGAVTEVHFDKCNNDSFFAINKDASMEELEEVVFKELALNPDEELERLRYTTKCVEENYIGVRIFDTPGYGSLIKEHGEVLNDFLPNADAVSYIVSYRVGFQEDDYEFLKGLMQLLREGVPFYLIINRCPEGVSNEDRRVKEIYRYVTSLLQKDNIPLLLIETQDLNVASSHNKIKDNMRRFIAGVMQELHSDERQKELRDVFAEYILDLISRIKAEIEKLQRNIEMNEDEKKKQNKALAEFVEKLKSAENNIIKPEFSAIRNKLPLWIETSRQRIEYNTNQEIDKQTKSSKDETASYVRMYVLNNYAKKEVEELQYYLETSINDIDDKVNNYLITAVIKFEADLQLNIPGKAYEAGINIVKGFGGKYVNAGLMSYFAKFGGTGGAGAGVANAASHALKNVGKLFGKTFSKGTHNAVKHSLKVLGLTSAKAIAAAAAAFIELAVVVMDYNTWMWRLKKQVSKTTHDWAKDVETVVSEDLNKLEWENIKLVRDIIQDMERNFSTEDTSEAFSIEYLNGVMENLEELERRVA